MLEAWWQAHKEDIAIVVFHGTADPGRPCRWNPLRAQTTPAYIDRCLSVLKKQCTFISMEQAVAVLRKEAAPVRHGVVVTFDDGYRNNIEDALPVLQKHGAPMTVFLSVSNIGDRRPLWFDRIDYALQTARGEDRTWRIGRKRHRFTARHRKELARSYSAFRRLIKAELLDEEEFISKVEEIAAFYEEAGGRCLKDFFETDPWSSLLTWDEVRRAQEAGVCFGSHAMDHVRLARLSPDIMRYQLAASKKEVEARTGRKCVYLAYPDGAFCHTVGEIALECGYEAAVTTEYGLNAPGCDLMALKRITLPPAADDLELLACIRGYAHSQVLPWLISRATYRETQRNVKRPSGS